MEGAAPDREQNVSRTLMQELQPLRWLQHWEHPHVNAHLSIQMAELALLECTSSEKIGVKLVWETTN